MSVYAEKKNGVPTGQWRVEVNRRVDGRQERYRHRHDSFAAAKADEERVKAMWAQGVALDAVNTRQSVGGPLTFREALPIIRSETRLWKNSSSEAKCWSRLEHAATIIGKEPIEGIDVRVGNRLITALEDEGKSVATINRYTSHLRCFLKQCVILGYRKTPIPEKMIAWTKESSGRIVYFTPEEEKAIYAYLEGRERPEATAMRDLIEVAINTGARPSELLRITLDDIRNHRVTLWKTKNGEKRTIPLSRRTEALLVNLVATGTMPTPRARRSWWEKIREHMGKTEDPDWVFYGCRHTCATRLLDANVNLYVIMEWMGHKVIQTTLRYAQMKPDNLDQALVKVGYLMAGGPQEANVYEDLSVPQTLPHGGVKQAFSAL